MSRWLEKFLDTDSRSRTDNTDRFKLASNMSVLSVPSRGHLDQNQKNISKISTDNTDRFKMNANMSVLSVPTEGPFDRESFLYDFEERIAIAEYDGNQTPLQAHSTAYLDSFLSILWEITKDAPHQYWLAQKIQIALASLEAHHFPTHH